MIKSQPAVITKDRRPITLSQPISKIFEKRKIFPPIPTEALAHVGEYEWYSETNRKAAAENLACAIVAVETNMPGQAVTRLVRTLEYYDTDRIEKTIDKAQDYYRKAKVFAVTKHLNSPITIKGENYIWAGQRLDEQQTIAREDHVIPKKVMKQLSLMRRDGLKFEDGHALFYPRKAYEDSMSLILSQQSDKLKNDTRSLALYIKDKLNRGTSTISSIVSKASAIGLASPRLKDPVLTGIIAGSLSERRYFFIELGRWIRSD
jgi:hypothetical protein